MQSSSSYRGGVFPSSTSSFESPRSSNPFASYSVQDNPLSGPAAGPASSPSTSATGAGASSYYYGSTTDGNGAAEAEDPWAGSSYYPSGSAAVTAPGPQAGSASNSGKGTSVATPGQAAVSGLLDESALPDIYHQAWRAAVAWSPAASTGSTFSGASPTSTSFLSLHKTLSAAAGLSASDTERIANLVSSSAASLPISASTGSLASGPFPGASSSPTKAPGVPSSSSRVTKAEYYVALALAALVQQKQAMSIEAVAARRSDPPVPTLDLSCFNNGNSLSHPSPQRQPSFGYATSPTQTRTHKVSQASSNDPWGSGANGSYNRAPAYSPSTGLHGENPLPSDSTSRLRRSSSTNPYSSFPPFEESEGGLGETSSLGGYDQTSPPSIVSSLGLPPFSSSSEFVRGLDSITVLQQHELAGTFLSRHTVYVVVSERRRTSVTRRYSDWIWLHEVLEKKYPSRIKMVLPPKRVGISARHLQIASDEQFLERRRRGLARYLSYVANHHAMRNERVINVFFNVDQDLSTWRKQNPDMETSDETQSQRLSSAQLSSVPTNLETTLATLREALPAVIDSSSRLCALLERVHHRNLASAADMLRAKMSLDSYGEILAGLSTGHAHAGRPKEVEEECLVLHRDMHKFSDALGHLAESAEVRSIEWENESLERLKLQREVWKGLLGLLDRYEQRLRHDAVDKTKKRIEANQTRFKALASATPESRKANYDEEVRKLLKSIEDDQDLVEKALQRREYLRYSLAQEIRWTWRWSTVLRVDLSNWSVRESEYQQRITRMWASLENALAIQE